MTKAGTDAALLIDTNAYLELFWLDTGSTLFDLLQQIKGHIFVSSQIVDEVLRNKVRKFNTFINVRLGEIDTADSPVPDRLLGLTAKEAAEFKNQFNKAKAARDKLKRLAQKTLYRIHQSEDAVTKRLEPIFENAFTPTDEELGNARRRKESGNPPGKKSDPLGDQIIWEQFLSYCAKRGIKRVWIVTKDSDYHDKIDKSCLLNPVLTRDLHRVGVSEIHCFDTLTGVEEFAKKSGIDVTRLPTAEESEELKKELDELQPLSEWFTYSTADEALAAHQRNLLLRFVANTSGDAAFGPLTIRTTGEPKPIVKRTTTETIED